LRTINVYSYRQINQSFAEAIVNLILRHYHMPTATDR
jgi:hypothetical protein